MLENMMDRQEMEKYQETVKKFKQRMEKPNFDDKDEKDGADKDIESGKSGKNGYLNY